MTRVKQSIVAVFLISLIINVYGWAQTKMDVAKVSAPPNANQAASNADTIACAIDTRCIMVVDKANYVDHSGTVTTGGTSYTAIAFNANRKHAVIQNPCSAIEVLFVNLTSAASATAVNSFEVRPCNIFETPAGSIPLTTEAITVTAATSGHKYIAKEQ